MKGIQLKTTTLLVFSLWLVKSLKKKHVNNRLLVHLEKNILFSDYPFYPDFLYGFRSFCSIADFLVVVSDRIPRTLYRSRATQTTTLDISKSFDRF